MNGIVWQVADFVSNLSYEALPPNVVGAAKKCILDSMANMLCGSESPACQMLQKCIGAPTTSEDSFVYVPGGKRFPVTEAAYVASVTARTSDLDDGHRVAMGHPGSFLIPMAMAYGQALKRTGKEILTAIVAGYETYIYVGSGINPSSYKERGFESTSVTGSVAATALLSNLKKLTKKETKNALGLAATFTGGLIEYQNDGSMAKVLGGMWAISTAQRAVKLAQGGFTGPEHIFEGKKGFCQAFSNDPKPQLIVDGIGKKFRIPEVYFKVHACMRGLHSSVDAAILLKEQYALQGEKIKSVKLLTTPFVARLSKPSPDTIIAAQSSVEYAVATALTYGNINSEAVLEEAMGNPKVKELAGKVFIVLDDEIAAYVKQNPSHWGTVKMVIETVDGNLYEKEVYLPRGEAENPLSWEELQNKFVRMIAETPYEPYGNSLYAQIHDFANLQDVETLYVPWEERK